jgi:GntR family transcriptional repressor for pyruvate dehydrogenase complex
MELFMGNNTSRRLIRDSLSSQIADRLIDEINQGVYIPGTLLPSENRLSKEFGVSRSVVREAMTVLSANGFIEVTSGKGATVREINDEPLKIFFERVLSTNPESLLDLLEIRSVLETKSAELAARRCTPEDIARLKTVIDEMADNLDNPDVHSELDICFHIELARCSGNSFLLHMVSSIRNMLVSVAKKLQMKPIQVVPAATQQLHQDIFEAVAKGDPEEAMRTMMAHYDNIIARIIATQEDEAQAVSHIERANRGPQPRLRG